MWTMIATRSVTLGWDTRRLASTGILNSAALRLTSSPDGPMDGPTNGPTDRSTDGPTTDQLDFVLRALQALRPCATQH